MKPAVMLLGRLTLCLIAIVSLVACSAESSAQNSSVQKEVAKQMEDLQ